MILGVDLGYTKVKTSAGVIFDSKISEERSIYSNANELTINGRTYQIGQGRTEMDFDKIDTDLTYICMAAALYRSGTGYDFDVVTGLPVGSYNEQKQKIKDAFTANNRFIVKTPKGDQREIRINRIEIFPQCAGAFYTYGAASCTQDVLIVDIGGRTVDICLFEYRSGQRKLTQYSTIPEGTIPLYAKVVKLVNAKETMGYTDSDGEKILLDGVFKNGVKRDVSYIKPIIADHIDSIINHLIVNYNAESRKVLLAGGGSYLLSQSIKKRLPGAELLPDAQFANANGFALVGEQLWKKN